MGVKEGKVRTGFPDGGRGKLRMTNLVNSADEWNSQLDLYCPRNSLLLFTFHEVKK